MKTRTIIACAAAALLVTSAAWAEDDRLIDNFGDWSAFAENEGGNKTCFMGSLPKKSEGKYKVRGEIHVLVSHRPAEKIFNEISFRAGYTYKEGSEVTVDIDDEAFKLFTDEGHAWAYDAKADAALAKAMRAGKSMVVRGSSSRGTTTTDTYSLKGFTAAHNAINKACNVK